MDDLELYGKNETEMKRLLDLVATFSSDIKLGIEKCRTVTIRGGVQRTQDEIVIVSNEEMKMEALKEEDMYKYMGLEQRKMTENGIVKKRLRREVLVHQSSCLLLIHLRKTTVVVETSCVGI